MDIDAIKSRLNQLQNTTSNSFWKPQPGKSQVRIVPYTHDKNNPFSELFFHYSLAASFQEARVWLMRPLNLGCLFVFLGIVVVHSHLGLKVIIEDYIADQQLQEKLIFASLWGFGLLGVSLVGAVIILFFRV